MEPIHEASNSLDLDKEPDSGKVRRIALIGTIDLVLKKMKEKYGN